MSAAGATTSNLALYRRLLRYMGPQWPAFVLAIFGFIVYSAANSGFGALVTYILDSVQSSATLTDMQRLSLPGLVILVVLVRGIGGLIGSYFMAQMAFRIVHRLRTEVLQRLLRLPLPFYDRHNSGHLISSVTFNVAQISGAVSDALVVSIREGLNIVGLMSWLLWLNWRLTLTFIVVTPLISAVVFFAARHLRRYSRRIQSSMGDVTQILNETLKGLKVIRTFGAERQQGQRFTDASQLNTQQNLKLALTAAISAPIIQTLVGCSFAFLLWLALAPQYQSGITPEQFVGFLITAGMLFKPVQQTSKVNADIQKGLAAAASIFALIDEPGEKDTGNYSVERVQGAVEYHHVNFHYQSSNEPVLHNLSLTIEPGQTVAIVGHSGSGKTTLVNLLPRFYDIHSGDILLDGRSLREYGLGNLRHQIALVSQQVVLFNGTVRDNVAYGELAGTPEAQIITALEHAHAMEFIRELPQGLDTVVGDDGLLLSGGQRQRLAIARALLKNAPILILDEATSALDSASERHIQDALQYLMKGRTTLVIAHRLSTIEGADRIVVMDKGRIVESGTHQQLLAMGGTYASLHRLQFAEVVSE
ncbi:MAG TPA: lipid A export permease/ATP-binding protein MsbA [Candidatus Acidoferrum sp.]|nr:lipid A export permease/ATP-binding protein MsbA [Candidatus Acidoferrum sp.]